MAASNSGCSSAAVPRTPAIMTGTMTGYNNTGSSTSRLRARTSIAANSVPTAAKPSVPATRIASQPEWLLQQRRLEQQADQRHEHAPPPRASSATMPSSLPDVDGRRGRPAPAAAPAAFRTAAHVRTCAPAPACRQSDRDAHKSPRPAPSGARAFAHEREREDQHARHGEEERRVGDLAAADLDGQILPQDQPRPVAANIASVSALGASAAYRRPRPIGGPQRSGRAAVSTTRPSRRNSASIQQAVGEVQIVRGQDDDAALAPQAAQPLDQRRGRGVVEAGERLVEQDQPRRVDQRAFERHALAHAARKGRLGSSARVASPACSSAAATRGGRARHAVQAGEERQVLARGQLRDRGTGRGRGRRCAHRSAAASAAPAPIVGYRTGRRAQQRGQHAEQRGLAGAVGAQHADDLRRARDENDTL